MISPKYNSLASSIRICFLLALLSFGVFLALNENSLVNAAGIFLIGAMFTHAVEIQHQCLHYSAFHSRRINKVVGMLLGLPTLTSFHAYRRSHLKHHRNLGTSLDAPFFTYRFVREPSLVSLFYDLFGISHIKSSLYAIFRHGDSRLIPITEGDEPSNFSEEFDYGLMGFLMVCATFSAFAFGSVIILKLWILPFVLVAQPLHFLIELPEHLGCEADSTDILRNTRTILGTRFSRWFTNYNNMHVEHHLEPTLSMDQTPEVYAKIAGQHKYISETYVDFYLSLYRSRKSLRFTSASDRYARGHA
ncbi:MAG: fatty acid desaturase [Pseudomonadota bacterium]